MTARAPTGRKAGFNFTGPLAGIGNSALNAFGVKTATQEAEAQVQAVRAKLPHPARIPLPLQLWLGARLPFATFVAILAFFTYLYHLVPIVPWMASFLCLMFAIIVCWPAKSIGNQRRRFVDWALMYAWFLAVGFAVVLGLIQYSIIESWVHTTFLPEFKNVQPNALPKSVMDAGILTFSKDATLNTTMSAGFKYWSHTICAAPIVQKENPTATPITFWAVGIDCCEKRADFGCNSAADTSARSGVPLRPQNLGPLVTEHYEQAVRMAAAANGLEIAKDHVFVQWHKDPRKVGKMAWWFCTVNFIVLTLIALCACCACQAGLTHISVMQQT